MQYTVSTILFSTNKTIQNDNKILYDESFFEPCYLNSYKIEGNDSCIFGKRFFGPAAADICQEK